MNLYMLDLDPGDAARSYADNHLASAIGGAASLLSHAWHWTANENYMDLADLREGAPSITPWIERTLGPDNLPNIPGETRMFHWRLCGQRIYAAGSDPRNAICEWVTALGGNYVWVYALASALLDEYKLYTGHDHRITPVIWTLEAVPPPLLDTVGQWAESPPAVPESFKVVVDGYYDTVASYRAAYRTMVRNPVWSRRPQPLWLNEPHSEESQTL